jgi:multicomponent Na+:H+ antiporter subunit D
MPRPPSLPLAVGHTSTDSLLYATGATLFAILLAAAGLRRKVPLAPPVRVLHALHSGVVGDYVTWVVVGTTVTGAAWALLLR